VNLDQVNKWLTLVANFGVIGGMVLVAMQMSLATEAINQQSDIELSRGIAAGEIAFMGDSTATAWSVAVFHPAELDEVQVAQLWAYLNNSLLAVQQTWLSNREGMAPDATWARARILGASYMDFGAGRIWWQEYKWSFEPDFVEEIDSELATRDSSNGVVQVAKRMLEEIHQLEQEPAMIPGS
jgi:hypothetical protein